ncbi:MAG: hypothetical protein HWN67_22435 [Candidatus Helarchaeota archaeon]|nr:hypothetical protein [Candidatus Helarchaeota archaeon]
MTTIKRVLGIIGTILFMILFLLFNNVYNQDTFRNFMLIQAIAGTILILLVFNPSTKRVKYAFLAGCATAISTFILGAYGTFVGWYLFLGGRIQILGVPLEMIIWVFFIGAASSVISEAPKILRKTSSLFRRFFDKIEHVEKLFGPILIFGISAYGTLLDFFSIQFGALELAPYWSFAFSYCIWLAISFITLITYNYLKMPYEFEKLNADEDLKTEL